MKNFAERYFERVKTFDYMLKEPIDKSLILSIVIPSYNEPEPEKVLESIKKNIFNNEFSVEILYVFNSSENTIENIRKVNNQGINKILQISKTISSNIKVFAIEACNLPAKYHGAGIARKIGMDIAMRRFSTINRPNGIIVSLDADTETASNYLQTIYEKFYKSDACAGVISYEHPTTGNLAPQIYKAIILYEMYLRYYIEALRFAGYPNAFHTIGSAFAVKAETYAKFGGMVWNKSGEDFYFLQKIIPHCRVTEIKETRVFPSPRITDRVIFGTGVAVRQIIENNFVYKVFNFDAFLLIKEFLSNVDNLFYKSIDEINVAPSIYNFLSELNIKKNCFSIRQNSKNTIKFKEHFYQWFDALKVLRLLNHLHKNDFVKKPVEHETVRLLKKIGYNTQEINPLALLKKMRFIQNSH